MALQQLRSRFRVLQNPNLIKLLSKTTTSSSSECDDPNLNTKEEEGVVNKNKKYKGVWRKKGKWAAQIADPQKGKVVWLGTFHTPEDASTAYHEAALRFGGMAIQEKKKSLSSTVRKHFIDLCIKEVNEEGRSITRLKPQSWTRVGQEMEKKFGLKFTQNQLLSRWRKLRDQYIAWSKLMNAAGHRYDAKTHTFDWSKDKWADFIKMVPESSRFQKEPLQYADELKTLFECTVMNDSQYVGGLQWSTSIKKYFIDLCIKELNEKGRLLTRLKRQSWNNVCQQLEKKFGSNFNQNQLSRQWTRLRSQYIAWSKLMNAAGSGYDSKTHTFDWSEDKWVAFVKMVPESSKFRKKPLQLANELRTLFEGTLGTENDANKPQTDDMPPVNGLQSISNSDQTSDAGVHRRKTLTTSDDGNDHKLGASVEECLKSLNELRASHDLPRHLYSAALKSFCQGKEYRIVWMAVTDPEDRVSFLLSLL
ncbi:hypothetical protein MKX01_014390 [Papaver californicum]|nr:hypothetical protein MKX01_014390 [Papaver californicum]